MSCRPHMHEYCKLLKFKTENELDCFLCKGGKKKGYNSYITCIKKLLFNIK